MIKADYHMHSFFSMDSHTSPRDMIEASLQLGLKTICFTDHMDKDVGKDGVECVFEPKAYFSVLRQLQEEYQNQIEVLIGVEFGMQMHLIDFFQELADTYPFDFIIGSQHMVGGKDPYYGEVFQDRTDEEVYRMTFEEMLENVKAQKEFDVLGHLDYVVRYGMQKEASYTYARFSDVIDEILKTVIERGKGIEINTAGLKYGLGFAHPHPDVLKRYHELGGEIITIGGDGHRPEHIAYEFQVVNDLLKSCGFKYYTEFRKRVPQFIQLS